MSKWGDRKVNGPERVILPKIYPVGLFWDGKKLARPVKKFIVWLFSLVSLKRLDQNTYSDFGNYAVEEIKKSIIEGLQILAFIFIVGFVLYGFIRGTIIITQEFYHFFF